MSILTESDSSDLSSDSSSSGISWLSYLKEKRGSRFLCDVDIRYIEDNFNLYGLRQVIPNYNDCLDIILDKSDVEEFEDDMLPDVIDLYGLIHARYILTTPGLEAMVRKYLRKEFGYCPRRSCERQAVMPTSMTDRLHQDAIYVFCPRCEQVYRPPDDDLGYAPLDGAYIGTSFAGMLLVSMPNLWNIEGKLKGALLDVFQPRVFGYKIRRAGALSGGRRSPEENENEPSKLRRNPRNSDRMDLIGEVNSASRTMTQRNESNKKSREDQGMMFTKGVAAMEERMDAVNTIVG